MARLDDEKRLAALRATGLLDTPAEAAFDRLTRLVSRLLHTEVAWISLVETQRQFFKSSIGLGEPWASRREVPISRSLCGIVVATKQPLVVEDARAHPLVADNRAIVDLEIVAYLGVPLVTSEGHVLGALSAVGRAPRAWSGDDVAVLGEIAASVMTVIELRIARSSIREQATVLHSVLESMGDGVVVLSPEGEVTLFNKAAKRLLGGREHATRAWPGHLQMFESNGVKPMPSSREPLARATRGTVSLGVDVVVRSLHLEDGERHLHIDAHPVRNAAGSVVAGVAVFRDTTQSRAAQAELQASEERFRLLAENSSDLVQIFTVDQHLVYCSSSSVHLLGYRQHEMLDLPQSVLFRDDERGALTRAFREAVESGVGGSPVVHCMRTKDGIGRWFETSLQPVAGPDGVSRVHSTSRDVTERVEAQAALAERELRMRRLADAAFEGISISEGGTIIDSNAAFANMFGYEPHEVLRRGVSFVVETERERVAGYLEGGFDGVYRTMGQRKDGSAFPIEVRGALVPWGERMVRISATRDLTSRVASEQAMQLHGEVLGNMAEGVCLVRVDDGSIVYANPRFMEMFGYAQSEVLGVSMSTLHEGELHRPGAGSHSVSMASESERRTRYEALSVRKDGVRFWTRATTSKMTHPDHGAVRVVVLEDITERKRETEQLARQTAFVDLLRETATEANAALSSAEAMRTCLERICAHMDWPVGHALVCAADTQEPTLVSQDLWHVQEPRRFADFQAATASLGFTTGRGLLGRVLATGQPQWLLDFSYDVELPRHDVARACGLRGGFALPVTVGSELVAVLEFFSERVEPGDADVLAVFADVGVQLGWVFERERTRAALERHAAQVQALSLADELTGLRNRRGFMTVASHQLRIAARTSQGALLFFADLNGMKRINDTLGHDTGDVAICAMADVLRASFREADVLARLGGDEFVVYASNADARAIPILRARVAASVDAFNARGEHPFELSVSLGAAIYDPHNPRSLEALLNEADEAMYAQKRARQGS